MRDTAIEAARGLLLVLTDLAKVEQSRLEFGRLMASAQGTAIILDRLTSDANRSIDDTPDIFAELHLINYTGPEIAGQNTEPTIVIDEKI